MGEGEGRGWNNGSGLREIEWSYPARSAVRASASMIAMSISGKVVR